MTPTDTLTTAIAARAEVSAKLEAGTRAHERGKQAAAAARAEVARRDTEEQEWIARDARRRAQRAAAGVGRAPSLVPDDKALLAKRRAEVTLASELQAVATLEAAEREVRQELAAAEAAVLQAAREVLFAEVRSEFETFRRQARELSAKRERLVAAYLGAGRGALRDLEWIEVDASRDASFIEMDVGSPWLDVPIHMLEQTGQRDRPREARFRIDALIPTFNARLEELAGGDASERRQQCAA